MTNATTTPSALDPETKQRIIDKEILTLANSTAEHFVQHYYDGMLSVELFNMENETEDGEKEVFQWYIVSPWFAEFAKENGAVILETDDLFFWGRECCGIAISDTQEIDTIFATL